MDEVFDFEVRGSFFKMFDPGETVKNETFSDEGYEPGVLSIFDRIYESGCDNVFFDIGALHGYYSCLVSVRYPEWFVHAYEPSPTAFLVLKKNFDLNGINGQANRVALTDRNSNFHFMGRSIVASQGIGVESVKGSRFDELIDLNGLDGCLVKIDVHGAEALVLEGMRGALQKVSDILIEVHASHLLVGDKGYSDIMGILEQAGFRVFEVVGFRETYDISMIPLHGQARRRFVDYSRWTEAQIKRERLIYATRRSVV